MVGLVGLLLSLSCVGYVIAGAFREMAARFSPRQIERYPLLASVGSAFWQVSSHCGSYLVTVALFVLVYRFMPSAEVTLRDTLPGAFLAGCCGKSRSTSSRGASVTFTTIRFMARSARWSPC